MSNDRIDKGKYYILMTQSPIRLQARYTVIALRVEGAL